MMYVRQSSAQKLCYILRSLTMENVQQEASAATVHTKQVMPIQQPCLKGWSVELIVFEVVSLGV